jgi:hypothetical protein
MLSVKGTFQNGVAQPIDPVEGHDGRAVIITFLDEPGPTDSPSAQDSDWDALDQLIESCTVRTGIDDLAYQHDHYLDGTPKRP